VCHSFGLEQDNLQTFEAAMARALAASGFPVLRYHAQGYGDSELPVERVTLRSQVEGAVEASSLLQTVAGISDVGLIGAKLGGSIALLAADRSAAAAAAVALLDPVVRGRAHMLASIRSGLIAELSDDGEPGGSPREDPIDAMRRDGYANVLGFPLRPEVFDEICDLDLIPAVRRFTGRSLVLQISRANQRRKGLGDLAEHLAGLGGACRFEVLADEDALRFGLPRLRAVGPSRKVDLLARLGELIAERTLTWCVRAAEDALGEPVAPR
jgi:pimeloyl-ACP methyl ester carboxylesterase